MLRNYIQRSQQQPNIEGRELIPRGLLWHRKNYMNEEIVRIGNLPSSILVSDVGITFLKDLEFDDWYKLMQTLQRLETAFQFGIGDALNYGQTQYGEKYSQAMDATGYAYQSLANWAWVSGSIPHHNRVSGLSWSHHRVVAKLPVDQQKEILLSAYSQQMSASDIVAVLTGDVEPQKRISVKVPDGMTADEASEILTKSASNKKEDVCASCPYRK